MAQASITLNGRIYRLNCGEGEEERLRQLSQIVSAKLDSLVAEFGQVGEDRLLLMSALLIADEMLEAKTRADALEEAAVKPPKRA
jgi:cell division protein ZapA